MSANKVRVLQLARQIENAMDEICALAEKDGEVNELICEKYPFRGSLDEVSMEVNAWRFAMAEKVPFTPYPNDCGSCHGKSSEDVAKCLDCGGTGEHQS